MSQQPHPTLINLPPPSSAPDTPSEMPGTPTSTTTSLSALSTTAIKDGHRGHLPQSGRGHTHQPSTTSLEAERADRISRLAGLERVSTVRAPPQQLGGISTSPQTTPTSTGFPSYAQLAPVYFDAHGQPVAATKMSTVGTASATESNNGDGGEARTTMDDQDEDLFSTDTNFREGGSIMSGQEPDTMEEDMTSRSVGGYEDRLSDDGSASLVGFGEGASSTISGPIYHRRPVPPAGSQAGHVGNPWTMDRSSSGVSDSMSVGRRDREASMGGDTPISMTTMQERRDARMVDGVAADGAGVPDEEMFVDTTNRAPVSVSQLPHAIAGQSSNQAFSREAAERIVQERLDSGEARIGKVALSSPKKGGSSLGRFYFEEKK